MQELKQKVVEADGEKLVCEYHLSDKNAVIVHGGGPQIEHKQYYEVAEELRKHGVGVVLFDLSGHGESTGKLSELSIARRKKQTKAVIDTVIPQDSLLYLVGFSMGAQTVCDLLPEYGERTRAILLACPAIYREDVQDLPFGTDTFTAKLRQTDSWKATAATKYLSDYDGKTVVAIGSDDTVIPKGVPVLLKQSAKNLIYEEYEGATHKFIAWLKEHPEELAHLITEFLN
jgi:alpha-beta hydrolase superfamily lysophospholipase